MNKVEFEIKLFIKFYNVFFFGGGNGNGEIQSYLLRDINKFPYISGAALKGCIAEYAAALSLLCPKFDHHEQLFGTGGVKQGSLYFENGNMTPESSSLYSGMQQNITEFRTGVSISRYTGVKKERQLYTMELSGMGGNMTFESSIYGFLDEDSFEKDIAYLVASARMIFALGGKRTAGLGWLEAPIECQVLTGTREPEPETESQTQIEPDVIDQWIRHWMEGITCTK